eukprot:GEMP01078998.1.p3 GENE.GEMP01078998.1~~GEMP01078998.1.p3  ORF type:complete len:102 (-),score=0.35 GEMP01078998.1:709-1014(-)
MDRVAWDDTGKHAIVQVYNASGCLWNTSLLHYFSLTINYIARGNARDETHLFFYYFGFQHNADLIFYETQKTYENKTLTHTNKAKESKNQVRVFLFFWHLI